MQQKPPTNVMGAAGSAARGAISNPFPVSAGLSRDLDKLSMVVARILSTPDIYDIENLTREGSCGRYVIMLRKGLERRLMPFVAKVKGARTDLVYIDPKKSMADYEARKAICKSLATTMIRVVFTVVASLASIQVVGSGQSREAAIAIAAATTSPKQTGGAVEEVRQWLVKNGYIAAEELRGAGIPMKMTVRGSVASRGIGFNLRLTTTEGNIIHGYIGVVGITTSDGREPGFLRVQFSNPIKIPGTERTMLPIRVLDSGSSPWLAGVLYENVFKSFIETTPHYYLPEMLEIFFRRTEGYTVELPESRPTMDRASDVFKRYRDTYDQQIIFQALSGFLQSYVVGYAPPGVGAYPAAVPWAPGAPGVAPPYVAPKPLPPAASLEGLGLGRLKATAEGPALYQRGAPTVPLTYDIPLGTAKHIEQTFKGYRTQIATQSSPAAVRARLLALKENEDRSVNIGICADPFWTEANLSKIYPWTTLQFLCVENWEDLANADRATTRFAGEWPTFLRGLQAAYDSIGVTLERPADTLFLDQMRIKGVADMPICKTGGPAPRVRYQEIQEGLGRIQELYQQHVRAVWALLNDLIFIVEDPDTKTEVVRLHPKVTQMDSSEAYVKEKTTQARDLISKFYVAVEQAYAETIATLKPV